MSTMKTKQELPKWFEGDVYEERLEVERFVKNVVGRNLNNDMEI